MHNEMVERLKGKVDVLEMVIDDIRGTIPIEEMHHLHGDLVELEIDVGKVSQKLHNLKEDDFESTVDVYPKGWSCTLCGKHIVNQVPADSDMGGNKVCISCAKKPICNHPDGCGHLAISGGKRCLLHGEKEGG